MAENQLEVEVEKMGGKAALASKVRAALQSLKVNAACVEAAVTKSQQLNLWSQKYPAEGTVVVREPHHLHLHLQVEGVGGVGGVTGEGEWVFEGEAKGLFTVGEGHFTGFFYWERNFPGDFRALTNFHIELTESYTFIQFYDDHWNLLAYVLATDALPVTGCGCGKGAWHLARRHT